jgi:dimethylhistidine N-methyltransferase
MTKVKQQSVMLEEVVEGLSQPQKMLPSKFFYDEKGSELFDEITELEEYYPTRTERKILEDNVHEIGEYLGKQIALIEPGSGSSNKTRILLNQLNNISAYIPIDISGDYIFKVAENLQQKYADIEIIPVQADYTFPFELPEMDPELRKVVFFPGSTIGNFKRDTVDRFLGIVADIVGNSGSFLIGVDLKKDVDILLAAYNDSKGVTAEFNKNILRHINKALNADFDLEKFRHESIWNQEEGRIEMHLIATEDHRVSIDGSDFYLEEGESIHTENSHKYSLDEFAEIVSPWFEVKKVWMDEDSLFSLQYLEPK